MAGVYGVVAYTVGQRSSEIGLRMALGARSSDVLRLILRQGMVLTGIGLTVGLIAAIAATRLVASMLFEVKASDPATYIGVAALLGVVSLAASYIPARRAARVDPASALRRD
jgi:ABC-type antimicrobial peptide transport system permease subunit